MQFVSILNHLLVNAYMHIKALKCLSANSRNLKSKMEANLDFVLSSVFVITSLLRRDGVGVATTEDWIAG